MGKGEGVALSDSVAQRQIASASRATPHGDGYRSPSHGRALDSVAIYAQVSGADRKAGLERQPRRLAECVSRSDMTLAVAPVPLALRGHEATPLLCVQFERASPTIFGR
jgi:hypothetical protein